MKWVELGKCYRKQGDKYVLSNYKTHPNFNAAIFIYPYKNTVVYDYKCLSEFYNESNESIRLLSKELNIEEITHQFILLFRECHNIKEGLQKNTRKVRKAEKKELEELSEVVISPKKEILKKKSPSRNSPTKSPVRKSPSKSPIRKSPYIDHDNNHDHDYSITSTSPIFIPKGLVINS